MDNSNKNSPGSVYDTEELRGFARSISELQILLLILVILYFFIPTEAITNNDAMIAAMVGYAAFVIGFRYINFKSDVSRWRLALETWAMVGFITAVLWNTGLVHSPLLNLYLLVIIACAITLGKMMTLLEVILIACCYFYMIYHSYATGDMANESLSILMAKFSPFLLVAYVTSMLAADILSAKKRIALLSQTDELTGLLNMRAFNLILDKEIARAARHRQPFTIVMIDIDGLKSINDQYGHPAGSRMIKVIGGSILDCIRASDVLARYGGDEFVILMTQTGNEHTRTVAERVRAAINKTSFDMGGSRVKATVSLGIASFPGSVEMPDDVLEKADIALYKSKKTGRDRVTFYEQVLESLPAYT